MILGDILIRNARLYGDAPALIFEGNEVSHRQLLDRVGGLITALNDLGVRRQERILFLGQNCPAYVETYGAAGLGGWIAVGLNYRLNATEQAVIIADCVPAVILFEAQYADRIAQLCDYLAQPPILICIGPLTETTSRTVYDYDALVTAAMARPCLRGAHDDDLVCLIYTSGTTGKPKGVMHAQDGQIAQAQICNATFAAQPDDRLLVVMPLYHIGALNVYLAYAWCGAAIVLHRAFDVEGVYASLGHEGVTAALFAPVMIQSLLEAPEPVRSTRHHLRTVVYSSAPMPVSLLRRALTHFGPVFIQVYGATENATATCLYKHQHRPDGTDYERALLASAGQPYFRCHVATRRPDGMACDAGEVGEVVVSSPSMMKGYWNNSVATLDALRDGWYLSGDVGYLDESGTLFLVDRKKDMIISGGENIYCREVEEALLTHASVFEVAVVGIPDDKWGESVAAFVVCRGNPPCSQVLIDHCRAHIASYKKPKTIVYVDALPRVLSTNKVDKKALRAPYWPTQARRI